MTKNERQAVIDYITAVENELKEPSGKVTSCKWEILHYLKRQNVQIC